jgi:uncharacterized membrane protein YdjX (TVP38/TMEM64 family)
MNLNIKQIAVLAAIMTVYVMCLFIVPKYILISISAALFGWILGTEIYPRIRW